MRTLTFPPATPSGRRAGRDTTVSLLLGQPEVPVAAAPRCGYDPGETPEEEAGVRWTYRLLGSTGIRVSRALLRDDVVRRRRRREDLGGALPARARGGRRLLRLCQRLLRRPRGRDPRKPDRSGAQIEWCSRRRSDSRWVRIPTTEGCRGDTSSVPSRASLRRLRTDRVEILFVHTFDPSTPIDETLRALDLVVRQGKALHVGVSNWAAWQIATALGISRCEALVGVLLRPTDVQSREAAGRGGDPPALPRRGARRRQLQPARRRSPLRSVRRGDAARARPSRGEPHVRRSLRRTTGTSTSPIGSPCWRGRSGVHPATLAVAWVKPHTRP